MVWISISFALYTASYKKLYSVRWYVTVVQGHPGLEIATNWKPVCDFLLVFDCNYMPIFHHFRDITIYWSKIGVFWPFCPPHLVWSHRKEFSCDLGTKFGLNKIRVSVLSGGENRIILRTLVLSQYQRVTDGQTDGRTDMPPIAKSNATKTTSGQI